MTHWFASTSLWKTTCPVSGHLIQRLSGDSRLNSVLIFGRTTSEIQFMLNFTLSVGRRSAVQATGLIKPPSLDTERTPALRSLTKVVTASTVREVARPFASSEPLRASTSAEPTTTPSAPCAIAAACAPFLTPKPTTTGSGVCRLIRSTAVATLPKSGVAAPVMPVIET